MLTLKSMQVEDEDHSLTAEAESSSELQQQLYKLALENSSGRGVQSLYSTISPTSAVYQVRSPGCSCSCRLPMASCHVSFV